MYCVEYYKSKKEKPTINEPLYTGDSRTDKILRRSYLHKKDVNDKCWNIKSVTISLRDIEYSMKDMGLKHLHSLYNDLLALPNDSSVKYITINNNTKMNLLYIYEIVNCKWMVNKDEVIDINDVLTIIKRLKPLLQSYENIDSKKYLRDEFDIIMYYIDTILNNEKLIEEFNETEEKPLRLSKRISKPNKETNC